VLLETANVGTLDRFRGRPPTLPSALDLALALHPTPAVAGAPTEARAATGQLEARPKSAVLSGGWMTERVWATGCGARLAGPRDPVRGAGIVGGSIRRGAGRDRLEVPRVPDALRWG
jgi:hypothetical protein